jgi:hypothetical protein
LRRADRALSAERAIVQWAERLPSVRSDIENLGHKIGRNTIKRILLENGIAPAPERGRRMSWATFIKAHLSVLVGMELFTVEVVTWLGLIRYHVLFAIDIASRKVEIVGIGWIEPRPLSARPVSGGY